MQNANYDRQAQIERAERIARFLNDALDIDRAAIATLCGMRVPCNQKLADHPTIQVRAEEDGTFSLGLIGLLNGLIGTDEKQHGYLAATFEVTCPNSCDFSQQLRNQTNCPVCGTRLVASQLKQFGVIEEV